MRALFVLVLLTSLASSASVARAQLFGAPAMMVAYEDRHHGPLNGELTPLGTSLVSWDGEAFEGAVGGGVGVAAAMRGFWPDWHESSEWAIEARVRVLATHLALGGPDVEVPIDLLVRWGAVSLHSHLDTSGWPTEVFTPDPVIPYVALGITLDVSTQRGLVRPGPALVGGIFWWLVPHFGLRFEAEVRAIFGDVRPLGQLGGSVALVIGL